jgi:non-canonical poly(A) RNA polymerase PAPD5/7
MSGSGSPKASSSSSKRRRSEDASSKKRKRTKRSPAEPEESAPPEPEPAGARGTEIGDDFVAFGASSDGDDEAGATAEPAPAPREWDEGKPAAREGGRAGRRERERERERRRDDDDDGFANKKQRLDAASRRAPWVDAVDWEACTNVAEMCVSPFSRARCSGR